MNDLRLIIGNLFEAPMGRMTMVSYFEYINSSGKLTARTLMEICTVILTFLEEQQRKNDQYEANFLEIEKILSKLVNQKVENKQEEVPAPEPKIIRTPEKEALYQRRVASLAKARATKKAKNVV